MSATDAAYPEDSIMCCVLPHKCNVYHRTPAAVVFSDTVWYLNVAFVACCLARIVWAALRTVHRYIKNNIMCQYTRLENHVDTAAAGNENPSLPPEDEGTTPNTDSNTTNVVVETSAKHGRRGDAAAAAAADIIACATSAKSTVATTELKRGREDEDARRRKTPLQFIEQDTDTSYLTDGRQPDSCSSGSIEELIDENCCSDEKECCVYKLDLDDRTANGEQCYIKNHDMQICPNINNRLYLTFPAKEFLRLINYKKHSPVKPKQKES